MTAILRDVPKTFSFEEQRTEINEIALDLYNLSLNNSKLDDLSVVVDPAGIPNLTYTSETGVFTYTPPDLSGFITVEQDPIFTNHVAYTITANDINNWNLAYSWGDHSVEGYIKGIGAFTLNALLDVVYTGTPSEGDIIKWYPTGINGAGWYLADDSGVDYTAFEVVKPNPTPIVGGDLTYDNTNGKFTFTPAEEYTLPIASTTILGGVKVDGNTINIDANGVITGATQGTVVTTDDTPPTNPNDGDLWWKSDEGQLKIWYQDVDSSAWIDTGGTGTVPGTGGGGGGGIGLGDLSVVKPNPTASGAGDVTYDNTNGEFTYTPPVIPANLSELVDDIGIVPFWQYADIFSFPALTSANEGSLAYSVQDSALYFSNGSAWTTNRVVTTSSSVTSDFQQLLGSYQRTYTISSEGHTGGTQFQNDQRAVVQLADNVGQTSKFVLHADTGLTLDRAQNQWGVDEITFGIEGGNYSISAESNAGLNDSTLRLTDSLTGNVDDILLQGADGLKIERPNENTILFRNAPTATQYTDDMAKDAAATALVNGNHNNITVTYDSTSKVINLTGQTGGGGGGTTYDLLGSNTTSNNAIITLTDVNNNANNDSITFVGGGGTDISWVQADNKIVINSNAYQVGTPAAASGSGDLALVGDTFTYTPPDLSSYLTSIPIATTTVLGGVKQGANCTIQADGTLDIVQGSYTLPIAGEGINGTLGGVKVDGSTITINSSGVISSSGGSTVPSIDDAQATSAVIADGARGDLEIAGHKGYVLYKIQADVESWVRIYCDNVSRQNDINRSEGNDPTPGSGVIAEVRTYGTGGSQLITPGVMGFNNDNPRADTIYLSINNRSGADSAITITLTLLKIGE